MRTISITLLTVCANGIAADHAGIDREGSGSGLNLRGSSTSIQDFQKYVKAQYWDDDWLTPSPLTPYPTPSPVIAIENVDELVDTTKSDAETGGENAGEGSQLENEVDTFELAEENAGFCATAGLLCTGNNSCCPGLTCVQGRNLKRCEYAENTFDQEKVINHQDFARNQEFLEGTEEASSDTIFCAGGGADCYTHASYLCCSGICNRYYPGSNLGRCV